MPYIPEVERVPYRAVIEELASQFPDDKSRRPGHLNYVVSLLIEKVYGPQMRYADHNEAIGALSCIQLELYRRKTAPYEDQKISSEGDLA